MANTENNSQKMDKIISLAKQRGFVYPGSEIYGGLQNAWDFGPLGVELKKNIKDEWWNWFVRRRGDMTGVETALIMNTKVWEASGHISNFTDPLSECEKCHKRFRTDYLEDKDKCPECEGHLLEAKQFNLMLTTHLGASEDKASEAYFRPETAQGMFVDFKNVLDSSRRRLPFGIAQIGKAFRNEITPGNYIFRTREFEQMEIEYFINIPKEDSEWEIAFEQWRLDMREWMNHIGLREEDIYELDVPKEDLAHYSKKTIDFEYKFPFGQKELYGLAYRTNFDLSNHGERSGQNIKYRDPISNEEFYPHVIEPTFGVERTVLAAMCSAYNEEEVGGEEGEKETRVVMKFPKWLAPVKAAILPLSKKEELTVPAKALADDLRKEFVVEYDETQSIGKRYRRQDEIGTPYCITFDFDSLEDKKVTVRDRDTMIQERIEIAGLANYLHEKLFK